MKANPGITEQEAYVMWTADMRKRGGKGGEAKVPKGFSMNPERAKTAGKLGGSISRRKANPKKENK